MRRKPNREKTIEDLVKAHKACVKAEDRWRSLFAHFLRVGNLDTLKKLEEMKCPSERLSGKLARKLDQLDPKPVVSQEACRKADRVTVVA